MENYVIILVMIFAIGLIITTFHFLCKELHIAALKRQLPKSTRKITVTAHTGCLGTTPNSIESMEKAVELGVDIVEFDLQFNKNGEPVLSHNEASSDAISLSEAFELLAKNKKLKANVDVKTTAYLEKVLSYAEEYGVVNQIFFTGIFQKDVSAVERSCPQIPYYLNYAVNSCGSTDAAYISHIIETVENCGAIGINMHYKGASKELVDAFHDAGLLVSVWTVNKRIDLCKMVKLSPDNITTKRPDKLNKILTK